MSSLRIKDKLSQLVRSQLPEFVSSEYSVFVEFLEAYYRYLEQDQYAYELIQNAQDYADIDLTASSFVNYFLTNYAKDFPVSALVNKRFFVKKIKDLYESKGSDLSFKLLFQILYGEEAETSHPYDLVLRASDGVWEQRLSIRVNIISGSAAGLVDKLLKVSKGGITYTDQILKVRYLEGTTYEIFIPSSSITPFSIDDTVYVGTSPGYDFLGIIIPTTSTLEVLEGGTGFKAGQIFNVTSQGGTGTLVKILKTNGDSSVTAAKIINYGYGYNSNTSIVFDLVTNIGVSSTSKTITSNTAGFVDTLTVATPHANTTPTRYFDTDYTSVFSSTGYLDYVIDYFDYFVDIYVQDSTTGSVLTLGYTFDAVLTTTSSSVGTPVDVETSALSIAQLKFNMGALARYPGEYKSSRGFISEPDVRLQDDNLYQPFAYQVKSNLDIETFYDIVKKLIHPAGTNLFSNRTLTNNANIRSNISVLTRSNVFLQLYDTYEIRELFGVQLTPVLFSNVTITDLEIFKRLPPSTNNETFELADINTFSLSKPLSNTVSISDTSILSISKPLANTLTLSDNSSLSFNKALANTVSYSDDGTILTIKLVYDDSVTPFDTFVYAAEKPTLANTLTISDSSSLSFNKPLANTVSVANVTSYEFITGINNVYSRTRITDNGLVTDLSYVVDYFNYFVDVYVVHPVSTF